MARRDIGRTQAFRAALWSKEREARRRRWEPDLQPAPETVGKEPLRLSIGATVSVLHDGHTYRAVVEGFTVLRAGCGDAEPGWRARTVATHGSQGVDPDVDGLRDPAIWRSRFSHMEPSTFPVLVGLGGRPLQPPVTAIDHELPAGMLAALADQELLAGKRRAMQTGRYWTVYGARTTTSEVGIPSRSGASGERPAKATV